MSEHKQMVADCIARESRLSDWERGFIESIGERIDRGQTLTEKQAETLDRVWNSATEKG